MKFIIRKKLPKELYTNSHLGIVPNEIAILMSLKHPNIIAYLDHYVEESYILLVTELFGRQWDHSLLGSKKTTADPSTKKLKAVGNVKSVNAKKSNNGSVSLSECSPLHRLSPEQEKAIKRRTSCDLFECIDARKSYFSSTLMQTYSTPFSNR